MSTQELEVNLFIDESQGDEQLVSKMEALRILGCAEGKLKKMRDEKLLPFHPYKKGYAYVLADLKRIATMDIWEINRILRKDPPVVHEPKVLKDHHIIPVDMMDVFNAIGEPLDVKNITIDAFTKRHLHIYKISEVISDRVFGNISMDNVQYAQYAESYSIWCKLKREELTVAPIDPNEWLPYVCELPERTIRYEVDNLGDFNKALEILRQVGDIHNNEGTISFEFVDKFFGRSWHTYRAKAVVKINGVVHAIRIRYNEKFAAYGKSEYGFDYDSRKTAYSFVNDNKHSFTKESIASMEEHGVFKKARMFMLLSSIAEDNMMKSNTYQPQRHFDHYNLKEEDMDAALRHIESMSSNMSGYGSELRKVMREKS